MLVIYVRSFVHIVLLALGNMPIFSFSFNMFIYMYCKLSKFKVFSLLQSYQYGEFGRLQIVAINNPTYKYYRFS